MTTSTHPDRTARSLPSERPTWNALQEHSEERSRHRIGRLRPAALALLGVITIAVGALVLGGGADDERRRTDRSRTATTTPVSDAASAATPTGSRLAVDGPDLGPGSTGEEVLVLQEQLAALGFDPGGVDGRFGPATAAAVRAFQTSAGLDADGVVGSRTRAALAQP